MRIKDEYLGMDGCPSPVAMESIPKKCTIAASVNINPNDSMEKIINDIAEEAALQFHSQIKRYFPSVKDQIQVIEGMVERWKKILEEFKVRKRI